METKVFYPSWAPFLLTALSFWQMNLVFCVTCRLPHNTVMQCVVHLKASAWKQKRFWRTMFDSVKEAYKALPTDGKAFRKQIDRSIFTKPQRTAPKRQLGALFSGIVWVRARQTLCFPSSPSCCWTVQNISNSAMHDLETYITYIQTYIHTIYILLCKCMQ